MTSTAAAEEDDGDNDEDQKDGNYGCCNDACSVGGWTTKESVEELVHFDIIVASKFILITSHLLTRAEQEQTTRFCMQDEASTSQEVDTLP